MDNWLKTKCFMAFLERLSLPPTLLITRALIADLVLFEIERAMKVRRLTDLEAILTAVHNRTKKSIPFYLERDGWDATEDQERHYVSGRK